MPKSNPWPQRMQTNRQHQRAAVMATRPEVVAPAARPAATAAATPPIAKTAARSSTPARKAVKKARVLTRLERFDLKQKQQRHQAETIAAARRQRAGTLA